MKRYEERKIAEDMVEWLQEEHADKFDFNKILLPIEVMLSNYKIKVLEDVRSRES